MKLTVDSEARMLLYEDGETTRTLLLYSDAALADLRNSYWNSPAGPSMKAALRRITYWTGDYLRRQ